MNTIILLVAFISIAFAGNSQTTYCNPVNLNYRYCISRQNWGSVDSTQSYREGADPTMLLFENEYYLFVSKSGGYWHSKDMLNWDFITSSNIPWEEYAPTVLEMDGKVYYMAAGQGLYRTSDPKLGKWEFIRKYKFSNFTDPCLFLDEDKRLYLYYGSADNLPLYGIELDMKNNFEPVGEVKPMITLHIDQYGWENKGWENVLNIPNSWLEGAWMNKYQGKYYLQYASPLQGRDYCDAVYIADNPLGPFTIAKHNPYAYKPSGFALGAGHGNTFKDVYGNYWHTGTVGINTKHLFERRINLLPAAFDAEDNLYANAYFGDYPYYIPSKPVKDISKLFTGWMLLSYHKPVEASSVLDTFALKNAVDENMRTFWSAKTGNKGEWLSIDLQRQYNVCAIQINFADNGVKLLGRADYKPYQYLIEYSNDNKKWNVLIDKINNTNDFPHDYFELKNRIKTRYLRITNHNVPDGTFAISGFRVFGKGNGHLPKKVKNIKIERNEADKKTVKISWDKVPDAVGYNVRYGIAKDKLYLNYQVYSDNSITISSLDKNANYYFTIDSFNENGITKGEQIKQD
jgi:xylan 1,4-beta-xylosidase